MNRLRRFLTPGCVLIAAIAICCTAPPAKADLTLTINEYASTADLLLGNAEQSKTYTPTTSNQTSTDFSGFTIGYSATALTGPYSDSVNLLTDIKSTTGSGIFTLTLSSSTGGGDGKTGPGYFNSIGSLGSTDYLYTNVMATKVSGNQSSISASSAYYGFNASGGTTQTVHDGGVNVTSPTGSHGMSSTLKAFTNEEKTFNLASITINTQVTAGSEDAFRASAIAFPEPAGISAAMAGLPCLGMLLGWVRMRRKVAEVVA